MTCARCSHWQGLRSTCRSSYAMSPPQPGSACSTQLEYSIVQVPISGGRLRRLGRVWRPIMLDEVVMWLADLRARHGADPERARCIASAARRIGGPAAERPTRGSDRVIKVTAVS